MSEVTNAHATPPNWNLRSRRESIGVVGTGVKLSTFTRSTLRLGMQDLPICQLLGQTVTEFGIGQDKRSPREFSFFKPQMVKLPVQERVGPTGLVKVYRTIKLLPRGGS